MVESVTPHIRIGPAGWSYPDWEGAVYPRNKGRRFDALEYLSTFFDLIEINSTFYRLPATRVCQSWVKRVSGNDSFTFTVKVHRDLTHGSAEAHASDAAEFAGAITPLADGGRLGSLLVQFPWSFKMTPGNRRYVDNLVDWLRPFPAAVEVRHGSWDSPEAMRFFEDAGIALCGIDQPLIGDSMGPAVYYPVGSQAYFRLHGRNKRTWFKRGAGRDERYNYMYSPDELAIWRRRIESVPSGVEKLFVVLNNHFRGQAVANALQLRSMLSGAGVDAPAALLDTYPQLRGPLRPAQPRCTHSTTQLRPSDQFELELFENNNQEQKGDGPDQNG